ncbi:ABC transporter ATP-binding protein [Rivibacter subsaxonicus]|uniref:ATP-binding cassette subfamily B protein/ATP-binding cassette subfamily C protein/ATP-binding cassette subfamily B multidrug efflux pump n=1 Tax=Rivibacter subsaxonicus TaxID=457575 RepID=A0A4Q7W2M5_9BURK|nr:ABC transporter ATP-binding protein [Rivibacter subsaxonicus]RZU02939.1 ATP-binding cassette subfamily B protein/ATP-binding cassette subfamily C protein/ATP-binding cassette subfamily B multidrug efflux pump [Rivibacter subsaxonicus]
MSSPELANPVEAATAPPPAPAQARRDAFALLWSAARPDIGQLRIGAFGLAIAAGLEALGPVLGKLLIDRHLLPQAGRGDPELLQIGGLLLGALLAGCLASLIRYGQLVRLAGLAMRSVRRLREQVYGHVLRLPMAYFDRAITGQLVSRVTNDTEAVQQLYVQVLFVMLDSLILLLGLLLAMAWLDLKLMSIVAVLLPAVVAIVWLYQRLSAPAVARSRELRSELNAQMAESIAGMAVLQADNAAPRFAQRYTGVNEAHYASRRIELRANAWLLRPALDLLNVALLASVIGLFGLRQFEATAGGGLSAVEIGVLYAFISYVSRVVDPLIQITMQFSQLQQAVVSAARVNVLLREAEAAQPASTAEVSRGAVSVRDLSFAYLPGRPVLHHLKLEIEPGEFIGVVGHTGSGKSTLLSLLLRFYPAPAGALCVDGLPVEALGEEAFRAALGLVPQEPFLLAASARENIAMGRALSDAQVRAAAEAARAHDFIAALEQGYDTPLGEGGARLSVGQKQLIAIARALAGAPKILLLDEATSHIDSATEREVQLALDALRGRVTTIAIAHRLSTIRDADRIVVMNHGRIAELGPHDALMQIEGGIYRRLYELQRLEEDEEINEEDAT